MPSFQNKDDHFILFVQSVVAFSWLLYIEQGLCDSLVLWVYGTVFSSNLGQIVNFFISSNTAVWENKSEAIYTIQSSLEVWTFPSSIVASRTDFAFVWNTDWLSKVSLIIIIATCTRTSTSTTTITNVCRYITGTLGSGNGHDTEIREETWDRSCFFPLYAIKII